MVVVVVVVVLVLVVVVVMVVVVVAVAFVVVAVVDIVVIVVLTDGRFPPGASRVEDPSVRAMPLHHHPDVLLEAPHRDQTRRRRRCRRNPLRPMRLSDLHPKAAAEAQTRRPRAGQEESGAR